MQSFLEESYKQELHVHAYKERKLHLETYNYLLTGVSGVGKTYLIKNYLKTQKKASYLYIDLSDTRIVAEAFNTIIHTFCQEKSITILVLENYDETYDIPNIRQTILTCKKILELENFLHVRVNPLEYEEFLAYERSYNASALSDFISTGALPLIQKCAHEERHTIIQKLLQDNCSEIGYKIIETLSLANTLIDSPFNIYSKIKQHTKTSKDSIYKYFDKLANEGYLHIIEKYAHKKAAKKYIVADIIFQNALSLHKNFIKIFEIIVALELLKRQKTLFYDDGINFYIPDENHLILCMPFADESRLFKKIEQLEPYIFTHNIHKVQLITMGANTTLTHPIAQIEMIEFSQWALSFDE